MKRFLRKIFKRKPRYEPAGIVHYGEWRFGDYYAQATPNGTHHVWHHDEYLGEYHGQRIEIVEHLHAKGQKRSEEHTSELQSRGHLVCRLLLEKKKNTGRESNIK